MKRRNRNQIEIQKSQWQRWNDYGIGLLLEATKAARRASWEAAQASHRSAWRADIHEPRASISKGRLDDAVAALQRA